MRNYPYKVLRELMMNNHGIGEVQDLLKENQSPAAEFNVGLATAFSAIVREPVDSESIQKDPETIQKTIQKDSNTIQKTIQKDPETIQKAIQKALK